MTQEAPCESWLVVDYDGNYGSRDDAIVVYEERSDEYLDVHRSCPSTSVMMIPGTLQE